MTTIPLRRDARDFLAALLEDLLSTGWNLRNAPADGRIPRNGLLLRLIAGNLDVSLRIFVYKVTTSGRSRPDERRIEITTTYQGGLTRRIGFSDLVLGIEGTSRKYVGVDNRRLGMGGPTHNASSFFDLEGLSVNSGDLLVNPRTVNASLFASGTEYHAFFDRSRLAEYLFSHQEIHTGAYSYNGPYKGAVSYRKKRLPSHLAEASAHGDTFVLVASRLPSDLPIRLADVEAFEKGLPIGGRRRKISPEELKRIQASCEENGLLGEQLVLERERRRLRRLGHTAAAKLAQRVSLTSVSEGYDIASFEDDGSTPRYLEVKSTIGSGLIVDVSLGEWKAARSLRGRYYLVRVVRLKNSPTILFFQDPYRLVQEERATKTEAGWRIDLTDRPPRAGD